nr:MAG TPA: hypothetical protein [Caudoviricetes sp.]
MSKNLIPAIIQMLGVEIGEKFKVKGDDELTYRFDSAGLKITHYSGIEIAEISANVAFVNLVNGKDEIVKLPWKPKDNDVYYTFVSAGAGIDCVYTLISYRWDGCVIDMALLKAGWVFRTRQEAEAALPKVAAEMGVEYEI